MHMLIGTRRQGWHPVDTVCNEHSKLGKLTNWGLQQRQHISVMNLRSSSAPTMLYVSMWGFSAEIALLTMPRYTPFLALAPAAAPHDHKIA